MSNNKDILAKGIRTVSLSMGIIILAPILITVGFKGIRLENTDGYIVLVVGVVAAIIGILLMAKGIKYFLDYWFDQ